MGKYDNEDFYLDDDISLHSEDFSIEDILAEFGTEKSFETEIIHSKNSKTLDVSDIFDIDDKKTVSKPEIKEEPIFEYEEKYGQQSFLNDIQVENDVETIEKKLIKDENERDYDFTYFDYNPDNMTELEQEFFGVGKYTRKEKIEESEKAVSAQIEEQEQSDNIKEKIRGIFSHILTRDDDASSYEEQYDEFLNNDQEKRYNNHFGEHIFRDSEKYIPEPEDPEEEPSLKETIQIYFSKLHSMHIRGFFAFVLSLIMAYISIGTELNFGVIEIFKTNTTVFSGVMLILLLLVMFCGVSVIIPGVLDIIRLTPGGESLVTIACFASIADALYSMLTGEAVCGTPLCAAAAFSMSFAIWGSRLLRNGYRTTFKTAMASSDPYTITARNDMADDGTLLVKTRSDIYGFIKRAEEADVAEYAYSYATPLMLIASLIFAAICSKYGGFPVFLHSLSAMTICAASFTVLLAGNLPFAKIAKHLSKCGAALAGYSGASEIASSVGVIVMDKDIFPEGNLSLNGIKIYSDNSNEKVIAYTASAISASGSGLTNVFIKLLNSYHKSILPVDNFDCYDGGGIGCDIYGDSVYVGSSGFMNLMGIRIPNNLNIKNAVFTSINGELAGVFAVNYVPTNSVQNALLSLLGSKIMTVFAVRDFNITPLMLQQKFKIPIGDVEFLNAGDRYKLSSDVEKGGKFPPAILCREGLGPLAEAVCGGIRYKIAVVRNTVLSIVGAVLGILIMFYLCVGGAFESVSVVNILIYMFMWSIPVFLISCGVNKY